MTGRGAANFLTRVTASLAAAFFATSLLLTLIASRTEAPSSIFDTPAAPEKGPAGESAPAKSTPPSSPGTGGGILDKLQPSGPSAPRVPQSK
jgi:preprotein translocase subunit SecG